MEPNPFSPPPVSAVLIILVVMGLSAGLLSITPRTALADPPQALENLQRDPTPTRAPESTNNIRGTSPVIGILVLLAPFIFLVWKSRGVKEPKVTASCCAPVIDERKRPFQIPEDPQTNNQPRT